MRTVQADIQLAVTSRKAINAFLDGAALQAWWGGERALVQPCEGGLYALTWNVSEAGFGFVTTGIITELDPAARLQIEQYTYFNPARDILGPMTLDVEARPTSDEHTLLRVTQDGYQDGADWDWYYASVLEAWPVVLESIKAYLE
ncbi:MAG TPA: SRPBCC domain-containing protein [Rhodothermales bacterium]|nr:SRPBCC domain-containing protein [Rhodothermales bacterium]